MDLFETGVNLMRQNLRRDYPDATEREIDDRLKTWLRHRPGAEVCSNAGIPFPAFLLELV